MALQKADLDWLAFCGFADTGLFAERLGRAHARAHAAENIGFEDRFGGPEIIPCSDFANKERNVDRGGTGRLARRIRAEIAALGFNKCLMPRQRWVNIGEIGFVVLCREAP